MVTSGRRPWSVRTWLILLVLATISPLAAYGLLSTVRSFQTERAALLDKTAELSRTLGRNTRRMLEQQLVGVEALAGDPGLATGEFARFAPLAAHYLSAIAPDAQLSVRNRAGQVLFETDSVSSEDKVLAQQSGLALHQRIFASGKPEVCLVPAAKPGHWVIAVAAPVIFDGKVVADITLDLPTGAVQRILDHEPIPAGWTAVVADQTGRLVARVPHDSAMLGEVGARDVRPFLASGKQNALLDTELPDGRGVVGELTRTNRFGWVSGVTMPRSMLFAPLRPVLLQLLTIGVVALGLSLMLALLVARRLSRPITALAEMAGQFDRSDIIPSAPPPSLREADEVARALELAMRRRRDAEDAAMDAELRATRVIEDAPCGVVLFGADGAWDFCNQATCELLDRPPEELLGLTIRSSDLDMRDHDGNLIPVEERASARALRGERVRGQEVSMLRGDGRRVHMLFNSAPLRDRDGRITGALTAMLDISDRRAAEDRLEKLLETLETRVEEEVTAREAAQAAAAHAQKMQALGQLAGGVAHDFNNVLQAISGAVSLIENRAHDPAAVRRFAHTAASAADRGASVAGRLLAFARRSDLAPAPVDAEALLQDVREILNHTLGKDVKIVAEADPGVGWLLADRAQLETALVNLATNARDAMPDGGTLTLRVGKEIVAPRQRVGLVAGPYVRLDVADTGTGMDAATLARATEPFFTTKPMEKGTGLGLAMVRGFAEQLNGCLAIESRLGIGTTVSMWLPSTEPARHRQDRPAPATAAPAAEGLRLLLVDDEAEVRSVLAEEITERGWTVEQASCAQEAVALLRERNFHILVADHSMPGETGVALIGFARQLRPGLPAVLLTGHAPEIGDELTGSAENSAITEVAGKPIRARELMRRIERLLAQAAAPAAE